MKVLRCLSLLGLLPSHGSRRRPYIEDSSLNGGPSPLPCQFGGVEVAFLVRHSWNEAFGGEFIAATWDQPGAI